jgi:hypothetical protein
MPPVTETVGTDARRRAFRVMALAFMLAVPSLYVIEKYLRDRMIPAYLLVVAIAAWLWESGRARRLETALGERRARWLALVSFLLLVVLFVVGYSMANSGRFGPGSDGDEALHQAARALLDGHYPYHQRTYLGNEITPMPGALVLAAPFVLLGNAAYQSLFWLGAGALTLWVCWHRNSARTWLFSALVLIASPAILHQLIIGSDYASNSLMVLLPAVGLATSASRSSGRLEIAALAVLFGLALSSRANFAFVFPLVASRLFQIHPPRRAAFIVGLVVSAGLAVTLPFLLYDPAGFSPLHTRRKLTEVSAVLPHADVVIPAIAAALSLCFVRPRWNRDTASMLRNATVVQAFLVVAATALGALVGGKPPLANTSFGTLFLFLGLGAYAATTAPSAHSRPEH